MHILLLTAYKRTGKDVFYQDLSRSSGQYRLIGLPAKVDESKVVAKYTWPLDDLHGRESTNVKWIVYHRDDPDVSIGRLHPNLTYPLRDNRQVQFDAPGFVKPNRFGFADHLKIVTYKRLGLIPETEDTLPDYDTKDWAWKVFVTTLWVMLLCWQFPTLSQFWQILVNLWLWLAKPSLFVDESHWKDILVVPVNMFMTKSEYTAAKEADPTFEVYSSPPPGYGWKFMLLRDVMIRIAWEMREDNPAVFRDHVIDQSVELEKEGEESVVLTDYRYPNEGDEWDNRIQLLYPAEPQTARLFRKEVAVPDASITSEHHLDNYRTHWLLVNSDESYKRCCELMPQYADYHPVFILYE